MASLGDLIARVLYPPDTVCLACGALHVDVQGMGLCAKCAALLVPMKPPFCPRCGAPGWAVACTDCAGKEASALDARVAAYSYDRTAKQLVAALKYGQVRAASRALAEGMAAVCPPDSFDMMVPVPLHGTRLRQRGFNQAQALCESLAERMWMPVISDAITRNRPTRTQTRLSAEGRRENVAGAFAATRPLTGLHILLVDDVMTTGATAEACAMALREAGAMQVVLLAAAKAAPGNDG